MTGYIWDGALWRVIPTGKLFVETPAGQKPVDRGDIWDGTAWRKWYPQNPPPPTNLRFLNMGAQINTIDIAWDPAAGATSYNVYVGYDGAAATVYYTTTTATAVYGIGMGYDRYHTWVVEAVGPFGDLSLTRSNQIGVWAGHPQQSIPGGSGTATANCSDFSRWSRNRWDYGGYRDPYWGWDVEATVENTSKERFHGHLLITNADLQAGILRINGNLGPYFHLVTCTAAYVGVQRGQDGKYNGDYDINPFYWSLGNNINYGSTAEPPAQGNVYNRPINGINTAWMYYTLPSNWFTAIYQNHAAYNGMLIYAYKPNSSTGQPFGCWKPSPSPGWKMTVSWPTIVTVSQVNTHP